MSHKVVPVGEWIGKRGGPTACPLCSAPIETLKTLICGIAPSSEGMEQGYSPPRCLRSGRHSIVACDGVDQSLDTDSWTDTSKAGTWCYECTRGKIVKIRFERSLKTAFPCFHEIWMLISRFTVWYLWKARSIKVFQDLVCPGRN